MSNDYSHYFIELPEVQPNKLNNLTLTQLEIRQYLDNHIAGQVETKESLTTLGWAYLSRCLGIDAGIREASLPRFNAFLTGPTGSGKTFSVQILAEALKMNLVRIDCANLTSTGYAGTDIIDALSREHLMDFNIILLDELDKCLIKPSSANGKDLGTDIQSNMLTLLDGTFSSPATHRNSGGASFAKRVNNSLVIATGSFSIKKNGILNLGGENYRKLQKSGLTDEFIESFAEMPFKEGKQKLMAAGFSDSFTDKLKHAFLNGWKDELTTRGFTPELAGRFQTIIQTEPVSRDTIREQFKLKGGTYKKYRNIFPSFSISKERKDKLVEMVYNSQFGMRDINTLIYREFTKYLKGK